MSFDEGFLAELIEAIAESGLQVILVGNAGAILHGVPVLTQDVDLMVRDHTELDRKLDLFARNLGSRSQVPTSRFLESFGLSGGR